ncbi:MAG: hypothetical protein V2A79_12750, partial [Planctomycetota bacterium]
MRQLRFTFDCAAPPDADPIIERAVNACGQPRVWTPYTPVWMSCAPDGNDLVCSFVPALSDDATYRLDLSPLTGGRPAGKPVPQAAKPVPQDPLDLGPLTGGRPARKSVPQDGWPITVPEGRKIVAQGASPGLGAHLSTLRPVGAEEWMKTSVAPLGLRICGIGFLACLDRLESRSHSLLRAGALGFIPPPLTELEDAWPSEDRPAGKPVPQAAEPIPQEPLDLSLLTGGRSIAERRAGSTRQPGAAAGETRPTVDYPTSKKVGHPRQVSHHSVTGGQRDTDLFIISVLVGDA